MSKRHGVRTEFRRAIEDELASLRELDQLAKQRPLTSAEERERKGRVAIVRRLTTNYKSYRRPTDICECGHGGERHDSNAIHQPCAVPGCDCVHFTPLLL